MTRFYTCCNAKLFTFYFLFFTSCFAFFQSCNDHSQKAASGNGVYIGLKGDFDSFNELNAADSDALQVIQNMLFMTLTRLDENFRHAPYLAKSWEFSENGAVLTYHLRNDIFWSDGQPTTADDVLFTYQMAVHPEVAYPAVSRFDLTEKVEKLDEFTIRFHFKQPYPDALFDTQIPILPKHILEKTAPESLTTAAFNRSPVGNGPFQLVEWQANHFVKFRANTAFALGRPALSEVTFVVIPNETTLLANLRTGELDVAPYLTTSGFQAVQAEPSLQVMRYEGREFAFIGWNNARPLFSKKVRQALTQAIDRREIIATLLAGHAKPANSPLMPYTWAYDSTISSPEFDPAAAQALLKAEGWRDTDNNGVLDKHGQPLSFAISVNAGNQLRSDIAVMVQAQLKNIGVAMQIETLEWNLFIDKVFVNRDFDAAILSWDADFTVNPHALWHSRAIEDGYNFVAYKNARVDLLLEKGRAIARREAAMPVWREFQQIIMDDSPYTFLFTPEQLAGISRRIRGVQMDARGFLCNIHQWRIGEE